MCYKRRESRHMTRMARCCVLHFGREFLENIPLKERGAKRKVVLVKDVEANGGVDIYLHSFLPSAPDGSEWLVFALIALVAKKREMASAE